MLEQITMQPICFWFCLGGFFLILELFSVCGYLLWFGVASIITAFIAWFTPAIPWNWQGLLFSIMIIFSVLIFCKWTKIENKSELLELNKKKHQLIGIKAYLISDTNNGYSRIRLADGSWPVYSSQKLLANTTVEVTNVDGITLIVKPIYSNHSSYKTTR